MKTPKEKLVSLSSIFRNPDGSINLDWNHREMSEQGYDLKPLMEEISSNTWQEETKSLKTDPVLLKQGETYRILQGHRRIQAIEALGWKEVKAKVYEDLTEIEIMMIINDQGNQKRINKAELFIAVCHCLEAGMPEMQIVVVLRGLLLEHFPRSEKEKADLKTDQQWLDSYRGVVQGLRRAFDSPTVVKDAYYAKLQGKQKWPSDSEVKEVLKVYVDEKKENPTYTKALPGPKFTERWNELVTVRTTERPDGDNRPKTASMLTRSQIEELYANEESPIGRIYLLRILNKITTDYFSATKKILQRIETAALNDDEKTNLIVILKSAGAKAAEPTTTEGETLKTEAVKS